MPKHQLCRNCGHPVNDNYCPSCGQRTTTHRLSWTAFVESVTSTFIGDEAYGLRGINMRKGAILTWIAILFQPHRAITEFIEGRRRKYFNPVAILLLLSTFYAIVFSLVGKVYVPRAADDQHPVTWLFNTYIDYATLHPAGYLLLMLPFFALAMKTIFRKKTDLHYVEYLYIGIFFAIFEITLMIAALPAELLLPRYNSFYACTLPLFFYSSFVFWKIFNLKKKGALLRTLLVDLLQYIYIFFITLILVLLVMGSYYLIAPEKFKQDFNFNSPSHVEQPTDKGTGLVHDIIYGITDALSNEDEDTEAIKAPADSLQRK